MEGIRFNGINEMGFNPYLITFKILWTSQGVFEHILARYVSERSSAEIIWMKHDALYLPIASDLQNQ